MVRKAMRFEEELYQEEMGRLLRAAYGALSTEYPDVVVYSASICTEPDARVSAVSFDTRQNSEAMVARMARWARDQHARMLAEDPQAAAALLRVPARNTNPADFAVRDIVEVRHKAFDPHWEESSGGRCWDLLEPALERAAAVALEIFSRLPLDQDAELGVSTRRDWYGRTWTLGPPAT